MPMLDDKSVDVFFEAVLAREIDAGWRWTVVEHRLGLALMIAPVGDVDVRCPIRLLAFVTRQGRECERKRGHARDEQFRA